VVRQFSFKNFILSEGLGKLSQEDKDSLNTLINKVKEGDEQWFDTNHIQVKIKNRISNSPEMWILNYIQGAPVDNPYMLLTRGLVIDREKGKVISMPFKRFGNMGEDMGGFKSVVDVSKSEILEKLDGSMLGVFFPTQDPKKPVWHTRKMISTHDLDVKTTGFSGDDEETLMQEAGKYVKQLNFSVEDTEDTWIFELIHKERPVITQYAPEALGVYLIGARNLNSFEEYSEDELDAMARKIGAKRPRRWETRSSHAEIKAMMDEFSDDFEGFVLRQKDTGDRAKVKKKEYLQRHALIGKTNYRTLIPLWIKGEQSEIVTYLPETKIKFDRIESLFNAKVKELTDISRHYKGIYSDKKSLAFGMQKDKVPLSNQPFVFSTFGTANEEIMIKRMIKSFYPDKIIELLGLRD
jgi:arsenate reductase-like glutaredoxin family protein